MHLGIPKFVDEPNSEEFCSYEEHGITHVASTFINTKTSSASVLAIIQVQI